jgi:hypothetical protein
MNLIYIADAMSIDEAAKKYLPAMKDVRNEVERELASHLNGSRE